MAIAVLAGSTGLVVRLIYTFRATFTLHNNAKLTSTTGLEHPLPTPRPSFLLRSLRLHTP
jgi:hypothetical protein